MENKNDIIDLGEWNVPTSWDKVTLGQLVRLSKNGNGIVGVLSVLTGHSEDEVRALPIEFLEEMAGMLSFLKEGLECGPSNSVEIGGEVYTVHTEKQMKVGEYVACDMVAKADPSDIPSFLAILARKDGEEYDSRFENEVLEKRREFWENAPCAKGMALVNFFLRLWAAYMTPSLLSSKLEEEISRMSRDISTSKKSGLLSAIYTKWLNARLRRLRKSIRNTSTTTSNSSRIRSRKHRQKKPKTTTKKN